MRYPVHCCCTPSKRLGYVEARRLPMNVAMFPVLRADGTTERVIITSVAEVHIEISRVANGQSEICRDIYQAVKSAHEPIDVWRRVPGFVEDEADVDQETFDNLRPDIRHERNDAT